MNLSRSLSLLIAVLFVLSCVLVGCNKAPQPVPAGNTTTVIATEKPTTAPTAAKATQAPTQYSAPKYVKDAWLTDLEIVKAGNVEIVPENTSKDNTGAEISHFIYPHSPYSEVVYNLNGDYDTLTAKWVVFYDKRDSSDKNDVDIYADDKLVFSSKTITSGDIPEDVSVDIKNCKILDIIFKQGTGSAALANIKLSNKEQREKNPDPGFNKELPCWLTDIPYFTNKNVQIFEKDAGVTNTGEGYSHYLFGKAGSEVVYFLNGRFERLNGLWTICYRNKDSKTENSFEIYADDDLVYTSPTITGKDTSVPVEADIKNCEKLKIVMKSGNGEGEFGNVRLFPGSTSALIHPTIESLVGDGDWLTAMDYLSNDDVAIQDKDTGISNTGETYSHYLFGKANSEVVYYLKGAYSKLTGVWTICQRNRDTDKSCAFEIYADDNLVYTSPEIKGGDLPVAVDQDIANCQKLKIVFTKGGGEAELVNIKVKK